MKVQRPGQEGEAQPVIEVDQVKIMAKHYNKSKSMMMIPKKTKGDRFPQLLNLNQEEGDL